MIIVKYRAPSIRKFSHAACIASAGSVRSEPNAERAQYVDLRTRRQQPCTCSNTIAQLTHAPLPSVNALHRTEEFLRSVFRSAVPSSTSVRRADDPGLPETGKCVANPQHFCRDKYTVVSLQRIVRLSAHDPAHDWNSVSALHSRTGPSVSSTLRRRRLI